MLYKYKTALKQTYTKKVLDIWSESEQTKFKEALRTYGKDW